MSLRGEESEDSLQVLAEPVVHRATGVLTLAYRTTPEEAFRRLEDAAHRHSVEPIDLAQVVVSVASGCAPPSEFRELIDREWGDLLF